MRLSDGMEMFRQDEPWKLVCASTSALAFVLLFLFLVSLCKVRPPKR